MSQIDVERAAFVDEDGRSMLTEDGLISRLQLEKLTPEESRHLLATYPALAAASLKGRPPTFQPR
jgi:hypothetical protein